MKKLTFSVATLILLAGSTFSAMPSIHSTATIASVAKPKTPKPTGGATPDSIPPVCPLSDPNGCGIYD